ncbi:hypothetical protein AB1Y20_006242 [Prymnesium parvum]|uniref:KxDL domain-containing protein n=1 Tax=Prymnesium parvum TaxID=97485 RepID=A0AB34J1Q2_PRYPA
MSDPPLPGDAARPGAACSSAQAFTASISGGIPEDHVAQLVRLQTTTFTSLRSASEQLAHFNRYSAAEHSRLASRFEAHAALLRQLQAELMDAFKRIRGIKQHLLETHPELRAAAKAAEERRNEEIEREVERRAACGAASGAEAGETMLPVDAAAGGTADEERREEAPPEPAADAAGIMGDETPPDEATLGRLLTKVELQCSAPAEGVGTPPDP